jgi:hypothetical protein
MTEIDKNYVHSMELWIDTQKKITEQKKESLQANKIQIELIKEENNLIERQILHDTLWVEKSIKDLEDYKESYK